MIPAFILAKLYVKGSLKNNEDGFEFELKNIIDSTMLTGIGPVKVGDVLYGPETLTITIGEDILQGSSITPKTAIPFRMSIRAKLSVKGEKLSSEEQRMIVTAVSSDIGEVKFEIKDTVQA